MLIRMMVFTFAMTAMFMTFYFLTKKFENKNNNDNNNNNNNDNYQLKKQINKSKKRN